MDEHEVSRLLGDAAASPSGPVDVEAIGLGIAKRRRIRRAVVGSAAASVLLVAGLATFALLERDDSQDVIVGTDSTTTSTTEPRTRSTFSGEWSGLVPAQPPVGVAIENDDGLSFIDLEFGTEFWAPDMGFADLSDVPGLESRVSARIPQAAEGEFRWWTPHGGGWSVHADLGVPLAYRGWVASPSGFLIDQEEQVQVEDDPARWWLSHDMRVVTWTACESGCGYEMYDSLTDERQAVPDGCWLAAAEGDDRVLICDEGTTVVVGGDRVDVGRTMGGEPAQAVAAWPNGMVWLDHGTCHASEALRIVDGEVLSLLTDPRWGGPSAIPLGMAPDGRAIVHLNAAACEAGDPDPGVYLVDLDTLARERVWAGAALPGEVRAWWSPPPRPWVIPEGTTEVDVTGLAGQYVTFGQEGVGVVVDGSVEWWWTEGLVRRAFSDGDGGIVFQEAGVSGEGVPMQEVTGAIRWMDSMGESAELISEGEHAYLHLVAEYEGALSAFVMRLSFPEPDEMSSMISTLHVLDIAMVQERPLGVIGEGVEWYLDGLAVGPSGLVLNLCHLQCELRLGVGVDEAHHIGSFNPISGFDVAGDLVATIEFGGDDLGPYNDPALVLRTFDSEIIRQVPLPYDPEGSAWSWVDLADDGRSALVVTPLLIVQEPDRYQVVLVTDLDTDSPRVQIVRTDNALRFG